MLGGECFDATRLFSENLSTNTRPVCEELCGRLLAFDRHTMLAGTRFLRRSAERLRALADELCPT